MIKPLTKLFLSATYNNVLEEIPEEDRVSICDDKSDTFSQIKEIEVKKSDPSPLPSPHYPPTQQVKVENFQW
uniref:Uncharacterized protein n=1 Tax=Romanomermis culicivorax TaxID=13658 RepID=A0A915IS93_ROMCU